MKTIFLDDLPDGLEDHLKQMEKLNESIQPIIQSQEEIRKVVEPMSSAVQKLYVDMPAVDALKRLGESTAIKNLGKLAISNMVPQYSFSNPLLESIGKNTAFAMRGMYSAASLLGEQAITMIG